MLARVPQEFHDWIKKSGGAKVEERCSTPYGCDSVECILLIDGVHNIGVYMRDGSPSAELTEFMSWKLDGIVLGHAKHHIFPVCAMTSYTAARQARRASGAH